MRDIIAEINEKLDEIERKEGVKILHAVESEGIYVRTASNGLGQLGSEFSILGEAVGHRVFGKQFHGV